MILVGLGGNLRGANNASTAVTLTGALQHLERCGVDLLMRSSWYRTRPVPDDGQPWYTNGVAAVETGLSPEDLLDLLLEAERHLGRVRERKNAPRAVDLDLLAYHDMVRDDLTCDGLTLPHPRMHERAFVLVPLVEILPDWCHPRFGVPARELLGALQHGDTVVRLDR